jgi:hypothetical protein
MQTLTLAAPELVLDPPAGPPALEKPVTVLLAAVRYPDSQEVSQDHVRTLGTLVYRGSPGSEEVWDEKNRTWTAAPADAAGLAALKPVPLSAAEGEPQPWKGILVAVGQKDKAGNPQFSKAQGGVPAYRLRAFAHVVRNGVEHRGVSGPSPELRFVSASENQRFAVSFDTETASDAGRARLMLKNSAVQPAGYLEIRAAGGQEIEIANCTSAGSVLARVTLSANGDIQLVPAPGRQIVLQGRLEAQQITYQPQGGGPRQTL